ncbi:dihydroxy-acid dehydratase [Altererythrobacter sp. BO-6]|uniref:IlvD/Edd family dehydratase n=1 Tax=Altererythrobacter sp. BO-6 TaxID=2604537 RepID=UPI0013E1F7F5|nr:IlvD/Edd family dehydratase [Altererythrobacter sp. BO-6]QIG53527.1 dihydroxy-acid dehydratase [Altererythrobacter sp. BO-6]
MGDTPKKLRSAHSYGKLDRDGFIHRSWMKAQGYPADAFDGRPVIGICNTWSEITPCNSHMRELADYVKRGVWEAGGLPLEFPAMSLGETQMRPTAMLFRNLLAMEVEESIRGNPIDGVVLLGGCDKTTPGQIMGAASVDLPTIVVSSGPMLNGKFRGRDIGSGTDVWKFSEAVRAGEMTQDEFMAAESGMSRSRGTCNTMGSASSFAAISEALGVSLKYNATIPAVDANRQAMSHATGRRIVELVRQDKRLSHFLTREAFENAIRVHAAIGGSTNSVIHLLALAGRVGVELTLDDFDRLAGDMPLLANIMPSGKYLMEDLHYAGGMPALMSAMAEKLHLGVETVSGMTLGEQIAGAEIYNPEVIATPDQPFKERSGIWVLRGNIAPDGAIIKPSAASPNLLKHRGKAVVFETIEDFKERIDDPDLEVDANSILVLKGCGPKGYPGMPEVGNMPLPQKLLAQGVTDMVRISDARMSGTAFGTVVLHTSPETSIGGPLGLVETGDEIELDAEARSVNLLVSDEELARRAALRPPEAFDTTRGYVALHRRHVMQAHLGADLDFLVGSSGAEVKRESH